MNHGGSSGGGFPGREAGEPLGWGGNNQPVLRGLLLAGLLALVSGSGLILVSLVLGRLNEALWLLEKQRGDSAMQAPAQPQPEQESPARLLAEVGRQREMTMRAMTEAPAPTSDRARHIVEANVFTSGNLLLTCSIIILGFNYIPTWIQARFLGWGIGPVPLHVKWKRRYGLPLPQPPGDVIRAVTVFNWPFLVICLIPAALAAFVVLLSPRLYDPLADLPPSVSATAVKLAESWHWVVVVFSLVLAPLLVSYGIRAWRHRRRLREMESWLDRGIPVCLACGGLLEGVEWRACPRCGELWSRWYPAEHGRPVLPAPAASQPQ